VEFYMHKICTKPTLVAAVLSSDVVLPATAASASGFTALMSRNTYNKNNNINISLPLITISQKGQGARSVDLLVERGLSVVPPGAPGTSTSTSILEYLFDELDSIEDPENLRVAVAFLRASVSPVFESNGSPTTVLHRMMDKGLYRELLLSHAKNVNHIDEYLAVCAQMAALCEPYDVSLASPGIWQKLLDKDAEIAADTFGMLLKSNILTKAQGIRIIEAIEGETSMEQRLGMLTVMCDLGMLEDGDKIECTHDGMRLKMRQEDIESRAELARKKQRNYRMWAAATTNGTSCCFKTLYATVDELTYLHEHGG
jgi:hypothetical protein